MCPPRIEEFPFQAVHHHIKMGSLISNVSNGHVHVFWLYMALSFEEQLSEKDK